MIRVFVVRQYPSLDETPACYKIMLTGLSMFEGKAVTQNAPFEIHVHGDVPLRWDVRLNAVEEALKPLWKYVGANSLAAAAQGVYEEEPGIRFHAKEHVLQMCWTLTGDEDFRQAMEDACMGLNEIAATGAPIEVSFYDAAFDDEEDDDPEAESRDDFAMFFVGPTPAAILQVQRDMMVHDVVHMMERHFDASELGPVVEAIDQLFTNRFESLVNSMQISKPPTGFGGGGGSHGNGGRKPRHLH